MVFHHVCILTDCYEASREFYLSVFEGSVIKENKGFHGREYNSWLTLGDIKLELQTPKETDNVKESSLERKGVVHIAFYTDDIESEYTRLKKMGIDTFLKKNGADIYTVMGEKLMKLQAPEGTIIEIRDTDIKGNI